MSLDGDAALGEPAGGREQPGRVGAAPLRFEVAPVERQGGRVEQLDVELSESLQIAACAAEDVALELGLAVGERDEVETDVAEHEGVPPLRDADHGVGQWAPINVGDGHRHPGSSVCVAAGARNDELGHVSDLAHPAVDDEFGAGDEARLFRREE